ncbi:hypothetical protein C7387_1704 [Yokenella regensburgei]|uniref:Uncharacterized protein n=1 Tax=Yokenella regensburgei TaxID=158877 RepID=A0ABX9S2S8_9ENTR|nr:hypothetical protein [Yokenella regensburgei]RKR64985.1 hypothetical protein C7387_1704 [Yokenella regensburgei]VFS14519.1 Uncharacterised protein [Yokenella regensburgei]
MNHKVFITLIGITLSNYSFAKNITEDANLRNNSHCENKQLISISEKPLLSPQKEENTAKETGADKVFVAKIREFVSSTNGGFLATRADGQALILYKGKGKSSIIIQVLGSLRKDDSGKSLVTAISEDMNTIIGLSQHDGNRNDYIPFMVNRNPDGTYGKMVPLEATTSSGNLLIETP